MTNKPNDINTISFKEAFDELGVQGISELANLLEWLATGKNFGMRRNQAVKQLNKSWSARFAPSLNSRGVASFFEMSAPRFAMRLYVESGAESPSLLNLHRLATMCNNLGPWSGRVAGLQESDRNPDTHEYTGLNRSPSNLIRKSSCIGDAILSVPRRLTTEGWMVLQDNYGQIYGEPGNLRGVPYVRTMRLSGLCAQAACLVTTLLLRKHVSQILGIAEISALAQSCHGDKMDKLEMPITGLNAGQMARYFKDIGVHSENEGFGKDTLCMSRHQDHSSYYEKALRAYLRSSLPVILPIDHGRMGGLKGNLEEELFSNNHNHHRDYSIYEANGFSPQSIHGNEEARRRHHAVVAVGYENRSHEGMFLLQDSSGLPFMKASAGQLVRAQVYTDDTMTVLSQASLISVKPDKAILPLGNLIPNPESSEKSRHLGLFRLSVEALHMLDVELERDSEPWNQLGEFMLVRLYGDEDLVSLKSFVKDQFGSLADFDKLLALVISQLSKKWTWIQCIPIRREVWVWDAERPAVADRKPETTNDYVIGIIRWGDQNRWELRGMTHAVAGTESHFKPHKNQTQISTLDFPEHLKRTLITSYSVRGLASTKAPLVPVPVDHCDLYCFMGEEALYQIPRPMNLRTRNLVNGLRMTLRQFMRNTPRLWLFKRVKNITRLRDGFKGKRPTFFDSRYRLGYRWPIPSNIEILAANIIGAVPRGTSIAKSAIKLKASLASSAGKEVEIVSMSSFIPDICSPDPLIRSRGVAAIRFLIHLAHEINPTRCAEGKFTIEAVAGTLAHGLWPFVGKDLEKDERTPFHKIQFMTNLVHPEKSFENLFRSLSELADSLTATNVKLAFEYEPGPMFLLGSRKRLLHFVHMLEQSAYQQFASHVGLNLDIAHWGLVDSMDTEWVRNQPLIIKRIIHAHIADHCRAGHLGDAVPGDIHTLDEFQNWIDFLEELPNLKRGVGDLEFSGFLSGELEACRSVSQIRKFAKVLNINVS